MINDNINLRIIANLERILAKKNKIRKLQKRPKMMKKDLDSRANDVLWRLRHDLNQPNLTTLVKWADALEIDISEFFIPI